MFSGPVGCPLWGFWNLDSLYLPWSLGKPKYSSEVVEQNMEPRGRVAVWGLQPGSGLASGVARTSLA